MTSGGLAVQGLDRWDLIQAFFFAMFSENTQIVYRMYVSHFQLQMFFKSIQMFEKVCDVCSFYSHLPLGGLTSLQCLQ